ncbi:OLC1v1031549C1 [Oldenlandia corymbosa var. corymbosa]|uniref:OLC1v1031549C1 n=1 Tax=Oldenlandia corymbosa var. corymbosa TaxID=529605 RepID=A0AAV1CKM4_OLDCO|nr:OLC1v1031549C1 [Oldenlandia corymbosa var. corymbosa]
MPQQEDWATSTSQRPSLSGESMKTLSERLSKLDNLYFPRAVQPSATTSAQRQSILFDLLSRDAAVFLERYGSELTSEELGEFDVLKGDYEINWHLRHLRSVLSPTVEQLKSRSATVKNRRRAYLDKLVSDGQYFSEDAMREREPYLHHELLGKFQDPSGRSMARPGERWSETLMRRSEEAMLVQKIRGEQQLRGVAEEDWVGNERPQEEEVEEVESEEMEVESDEEESEEEEQCKKFEKRNMKSHIDGASQSQEGMKEDQGAASSVRNSQQATIGQPPEQESLSLEEMQDRMDHFTFIMQQKFLSGEDHQYMDYSKIDENESLDDHWMRELNGDAEEKYFDDD